MCDSDAEKDLASIISYILFIILTIVFQMFLVASVSIIILLLLLFNNTIKALSKLLIKQTRLNFTTPIFTILQKSGISY